MPRKFEDGIDCGGGDVENVNLVDGVDVSNHKDRHVSGGADAFLAADIIEAIVKRIRETGDPTTLDFGAIADGSFLKRSGASIIAAALAGGGNFGQEFQYAEVTARTTTTSATFQTKVTLTTSALAGGDYLIFWMAYGDGTVAAADGDYRVLEDGVNALQVMTERFIDSSIRRFVGGFIKKTLAAGVHTYAVQWRDVPPSGDTFGISEARVLLFRLS